LMYVFFEKIKTRGSFGKLDLKDKFFLGILGLSYLMMSLELFLGEFRTFYIDIRLMTWAAILLFIVYSFLPSNKRVL